MQQFKAILETDSFYHIYNRANGNEKLFLNDDNYSYFLKRYNYYISPIAETFAYCLMPNHFHFLIKIKSDIDLLHLTGFEKLLSEEISNKLSLQFSNLFNSYTKSFNKQYNRSGNLFSRPFNRIKITNEKQLKYTLNYIHQNPVSHAYVKQLSDWKFSSYSSFFTEKITKINNKEVLDWFGDIENFEYYHNLKKAEDLAEEMSLFY